MKKIWIRDKHFGSTTLIEITGIFTKQNVRNVRNVPRYVSFLLYLHQIAEGQWKDQIWQGFHFPTQKKLNVRNDACR
jgi:hypothetical protein